MASSMPFCCAVHSRHGFVAVGLASPELVGVTCPLPARSLWLERQCIAVGPAWVMGFLCGRRMGLSAKGEPGSRGKELQVVFSQQYLPPTCSSCSGIFLLLPKEEGTRSLSLELEQACDNGQSNSIPDLALGHKGDAPSIQFSWDARSWKPAAMERSHVSARVRSHEPCERTFGRSQLPATEPPSGAELPHLNPHRA